MNLSRNGLVVLISVIFVAGVGTAYAGIVLPTITLSGNVVVTDDLTVDTDTLVVDSTNDRVGIGTTTPSSPLHIFGPDPSIFLQRTSGLSSLQFKSPTSTDDARLSFHTTPPTQFNIQNVGCNR